MQTNFPAGIDNFRQPHESEDLDEGRLNRRMMAVLLAAALPVAMPAIADDAQAQQPAPAPAPAPAQPALGPSMTGPLHLNTNPLHLDGGPLGPVHVSGVISGIGLVQDHPFPGDRKSVADLSNGMAIVQTVQGPVQFYAQVGGYSITTLGTPYFKARHYVNDTYGYLPVAYVKLVPSSDFNVQIGKLYTLQGAENAFSFQNFNIERGLLFNQTSTINRGVQANYAHGPLSVSWPSPTAIIRGSTTGCRERSVTRSHRRTALPSALPRASATTPSRPSRRRPSSTTASSIFSAGPTLMGRGPSSPTSSSAMFRPAKASGSSIVHRLTQQRSSASTASTISGPSRPGRRSSSRRAP